MPAVSQQSFSSTRRAVKIAAAFLGILLIGGAAFAQQGTAPNGNYPAGYTGNTWTGVVSNVNEATGEFTLTFTKGSKTETFVGVPEKEYLVAPKDGPERPLKLSDIHVGRTLTVFYTLETKKVDGKKVTFNSVFYINSIPNNRKVMTYFKAFD
jgi:hypothetical protein